MANIAYRGSNAANALAFGGVRGSTPRRARGSGKAAMKRGM